MPAATWSDAQETDLGDYIPDMELENDLMTGTEGLQEVTLADIHQDVVLCNQLLGVLIALLVLQYGLNLIEFFIKLITENITNLF